MHAQMFAFTLEKMKLRNLMHSTSGLNKIHAFRDRQQNDDSLDRMVTFKRVKAFTRRQGFTRSFETHEAMTLNFCFILWPPDRIIKACPLV